MTVSVRYQGKGRSSVACSEVKRRAARMLRALNYEKAELSVLLCDDAVICELNRKYRRKDHPTDVLSFSMEEGESVLGSTSILGDIVISVPTANRQAIVNKHDLLDEITLLLAHGLLHLLGFDHRTAAQEKRMRAGIDVLVSSVKRTT
jgi:probable rRNA maturation factor